MPNAAYQIMSKVSPFLLIHRLYNPQGYYNKSNEILSISASIEVKRRFSLIANKTK